jgi:hypothetical protein
MRYTSRILCCVGLALFTWGMIDKREYLWLADAVVLCAAAYCVGRDDGGNR